MQKIGLLMCSYCLEVDTEDLGVILVESWNCIMVIAVFLQSGVFASVLFCRNG